MKFKLNENMPVEAAVVFRNASYEVNTVGDEQLAGHIDPLIASVCQSENRILVTLDLDFSDIRHYPPEEYPGIIVLRPAIQNRGAILRLVEQLISFLSIHPIQNQLWLVNEAGLRIRGDEGP